MRTAAVIAAIALIVLAIPALVRLDSLIRVGSRRRALRESGRFLIAIAAAAGLLVFAWRGR